MVAELRTHTTMTTEFILAVLVHCFLIALLLSLLCS